MALSWREGDAAGSAGPAGRVWSDVRLALGSVADRPIRASATEAVLEGAAPTADTADTAAATAQRIRLLMSDLLGLNGRNQMNNWIAG